MARVRRSPLLIVLAVLALLVASGFTANAVLTAPVGTPAAAEFAEAPVSDTLTDATVIALGEATHGTSEFQLARLTLLQKVVGRGFTTLAFEEDAGSMTLVNDWVQGGKGTLTEAVNRFGFQINHTAETGALLQWIRDYNASAPKAGRIQLYGVDAARPVQDKQVALSWLSTKDAAAAKAFEARLAALTDDTDDSASPADVTTAAAELAEAVETAAKGDTSDAAGRAVLSARAISKDRQWLAAGMPGPVRDAYMAEQLALIVNQRAANGGQHTLLFAHNGHVDKAAQATAVGGDTMGSLSAARWGAKYKAIGTDAQHAAVRSEDQVVSVTVNSPIRGLFAKTAQGYLEIAATTGENRALLDRRWPMLSAGAGFTPLQAVLPPLHEVQVVPSAAWDALIYVTDAHPTNPIQ